MQEYDQRVSQATQAQTARHLAALFADLPGPHPVVGTPAAFAAPMPPAYPAAPYGAIPYSDKSKLAAGLLQILLPFGIGRFYTGHTGIAVAQLLLFWLGILPCGIGTLAAFVWCVIDGIVLLASNSTDAHGRLLKN